jgi:hypothetical protein
MSGMGWHYTPCGGGRGKVGLGAVLGLGALAVAVSHAHAIESGADDVLRIVVEIVEIIAAVAIGAGVTIGAIALRRRRAAAELAAPVRATAVITRPGRPAAAAIGPPHPSPASAIDPAEALDALATLWGVTTDEMRAILGHAAITADLLAARIASVRGGDR